MNLEPIFQVGKSSVTPEIVNAISECFNTHELIKLSVIAERTHSQVVQVIGKKIVLYKPDKDDPKIVLP